jgi:hypothetical protein
LDIDLLVRNVLADLSFKPVAQTEPIIIDERELIVESRVLSLVELKNHLDTVRKIVVSPKTVVTPSVKDVLRKRNIELATKIQNTVTEKKTSLWLGVFPPSVLSQKLSERIKKDFGLTAQAFGTLLELIDEAEHLVKTARGVALSNKSASMMKAANRREEIRAIVGYESRQTQTDTAELDANLLVVDPGRVGEFRVVELMKAYSAVPVGMSHTVPSPSGRGLG